MTVQRASVCQNVDVVVVVVTYNSSETLPRFVAAALASADGMALSIVVVDNASTDDTVVVARGLGVHVLERGFNAGYAGGINFGRRVASGARAVFIANPDLVLERGALKALFDAVVLHGGVAVPRLIAPSGSLQLSLRREPTVTRQLGEAVLGDHLPRRPALLAEIIRDPSVYEERREVDWAEGAAMMVSRNCDEAVGDWDETYFLFSEEVDYARRVRTLGHGVQYIPDAVAVHESGGSRRDLPVVHLVAVNRIRYYSKFHSRPSTTLYSLVVLLELMLRAGRPHHRMAIGPVLRAVVQVVFGGGIPSLEADSLRSGT